jgi:hypothetical protein
MLGNSRIARRGAAAFGRAKVMRFLSPEEKRREVLRWRDLCSDRSMRLIVAFFRTLHAKARAA